MAETAAYLTKLQIAPDSAGSAGSYATLGGNPKADFKFKLDTKDTTPLGGTGDHTLLATLKSFTVSGSTFYDHADTATATIEAGSRTQVWAKFFTNATNFYSGPCLVTDLSFSDSADGVVELSFTLTSTGAITVG